MSYNGVGLATARGSGTNGYVQRNVSAVKHRKPATDYKRDTPSSDRPLHRQPNAELLEHERKRAIELKCAEMQDRMEEQG
jgi:serine/arginine repetitive matrix protein 2